MKEFKIKLINETLDKVIQERLFELGYRWADSYKDSYNPNPYRDYKKDTALLLQVEKITYSNSDYLNKESYKNIPWVSIEELFSFEVNKTFKLNADFEVEIDKKKQSVKTPEGIFLFYELKELKELIKSRFFNGNVVHTNPTQVVIGCKTFERTALEELFKLCEI